MAVSSGLACWPRYSTVNIYAFIWVKLGTDLHLTWLGNHEVCKHWHTGSHNLLGRFHPFTGHVDP